MQVGRKEDGGKMRKLELRYRTPPRCPIPKSTI